ncbi:alcohol dehydrogenase catalytic domain-containing protein [Nocardia thailandica]|uniref:alcohol dehydrogenase catalytic domain-containing protein n=1 Tax=Nocardia thailandica TaxID=257275 RepID=UPI0002DB5BAE|nr:zinc-binding dehydrogenase [Nocardia thailandica]
MRAVVIERFGEPAEVLRLAQRPVPEPGPGEVRVAMTLSPIHNHDLAIVRGVYGYRPPLPAIPGTEAAGVVEAVGPGVDTVAAGQRVAVPGARAAWAEFFLARADQVVPLPPAVPDETACQLLAMPLSTLLLLDDLGVAAGDWIAVNAANGAVGRLLNLFARQRGVRVLSLVRDEAAARALTELGHPSVVDTSAPGWRDEAAGITGGAPVVRAVDQVSGTAGADLLALLAPKGELISFGALSGRPLELDTGALIFKQAVVKGFWGQQRGAEIDAGTRVRLVTELLGLAATGTLRMAVAAEYPLDEAAEAAAATERPGRNGKVLLHAGAR